MIECVNSNAADRYLGQIEVALALIDEAAKVTSSSNVMRETEDFFLERVGNHYWLTNRSVFDATEDGDREVNFNQYNNGIGYDGEVEELCQHETDAEFNAACLTYFGYNIGEAKSLFEVCV